VASTVTGPRAVELLDTKASEQIKRHNALRHQVRVVARVCREAVFSFSLPVSEHPNASET
jgi:hypothetical protein